MILSPICYRLLLLQQTKQSLTVTKMKLCWRIKLELELEHIK